MSGPDYGPAFGSNAIGSFIIGVSPIGSIPQFDVWTTVIQQYANSDSLTTLITNFAQYVDQTVNIDAFFDLMWNVDTAQGYGLDVWGRIVGVQRTLHVAQQGLYFGFQEATGLSAAPFNVGSFYNGAPLVDNFNLSDSAFRTLIFAKALSNISDGSIPAINQILLNLFPHRGNCFVVDNLNMTMEYRFDFILTDVEAAIIQQSGVLPKPIGVTATVVQP